MKERCQSVDLVKNNVSPSPLPPPWKMLMWVTKMFVFIDLFHGNLQVPLENERSVFSSWGSFTVRIFSFPMKEKELKIFKERHLSLWIHGFYWMPSFPARLLFAYVYWWLNGFPLMRMLLQGDYKACWDIHCHLLFWTVLVTSCHLCRTHHCPTLLVDLTHHLFFWWSLLAAWSSRWPSSIVLEGVLFIWKTGGTVWLEFFSVKTLI